MKLVIYLQLIINFTRIYLFIFIQLLIPYGIFISFAIHLQGYTSRVDASFDLFKRQTVAVLFYYYYYYLNIYDLIYLMYPFIIFKYTALQ